MSLNDYIKRLEKRTKAAKKSPWAKSMDNYFQKSTTTDKCEWKPILKRRAI